MGRSYLPHGGGGRSLRVLAEPIKVLATNIAGTERLLRAISKGGWEPHVIIASSSEVYGHSAARELREDAELIIQSGARSRWNYAVSKLADEALGISYARKDGVPVTIVRFCNTIGPDRRDVTAWSFPASSLRRCRASP